MHVVATVRRSYPLLEHRVAAIRRVHRFRMRADVQKLRSYAIGSMRSFFALALFGGASFVVASASLYGVLGGVEAELQVPLCALGLIAGSVGVGVALLALLLRAARWALRSVR